jgi:energy-converting hydrogenase B subunit Q
VVGSLALLVVTRDVPGALYRVFEVIYRHGANITYIATSDVDETQIELELVSDPDALIADLQALELVNAVHRVPSFQAVFGKRVIVMGGGAQVGAVAQGAIAEADRHNIRGEKISIDTIPVVGEDNLAATVRAVARLPRVAALVLAGALMGGEITRAVREVRDKGILVVSLNMAGSVPRASDLVVSDPLQAGVMTVMAIARTARFDISHQRGRVY